MTHTHTHIYVIYRNREREKNSMCKIFARCTVIDHWHASLASVLQLLRKCHTNCMPLA